MFLKKLFYASASILMLVLAYHLGAAIAKAQSTPQRTPDAAVALSDSDYLVATANGSIYHADGSGGWFFVTNVFGVPSSSNSIVDIGDSDYFVATANGNIYQSNGSGGWFLKGNVFGIPSTSNPVVSISSYNDFVATANGSIYQTDGSGGWYLKGNVFGGATPAAPQSFGALKAKYR